MKLSCHTIIVDDYPNNGESVVYHTRTQAMVKVDDGLKNVLNNLEELNADTFAQQQSDLEQLHRMGIVVNDEQEDMNRLKGHLDQLKYSYDKSYYGVTILTTYGCNFKCVYCFEESTRTMKKMEVETQEQAIAWLKNKLITKGYRRLFINFYGGEPLLNPEAIVNISTEMQRWCNTNDRTFAFSLQTNGYLLTPKKVEQYNKLGLKRVRISVDGVGEEHDRTRPLRGGGGTFDRIMKNITDCAGKTEIAISMSYSDNDLGPVERLLNYFDDKGLLHKLGGQFLFTPVIPTVGPKGNPQMIQGSDCMCNSEDKVLAKSVSAIDKLLESKGLPNGSGMATSTCPLVKENGASTIDQEGRLYRCNSLLGHPEFSVGNIFDEHLNEKHKEFRDLDVWKQCPTDCTYLPMCSGGCRLMSFVGGNKNFKVASCKKPYLNQMAAEFIKRDYDRMTTQKKMNNKEKTLV